VDVQGGDHAFGQHTGAKAARGAAGDLATEDELHPVGAAEVEALADDLCKELPAGLGAVEPLSERELGLQDGPGLAVTRLPVLGAKGMRQPCEPLAQYRRDFLGVQLLAQLLQPLRVLAPEDAVVEGGEGDALLGPS
jgi:hypothetical protein